MALTGLWFDISVIFLRLPSEKNMIVSWKKKEFEDFEDLLFSFRLYFVIGSQFMYLYHILFATINIYGIVVLIVKKIMLVHLFYEFNLQLPLLHFNGG